MFRHHFSFSVTSSPLQLQEAFNISMAVMQLQAPGMTAEDKQCMHVKQIDLNDFPPPTAKYTLVAKHLALFAKH